MLVSCERTANEVRVVDRGNRNDDRVTYLKKVFQFCVIGNAIRRSNSFAARIIDIENTGKRCCSGGRCLLSVIISENASSGDTHS